MAVVWLTAAGGLIGLVLLSRCEVCLRVSADCDGVYASVTAYLLDGMIRLYYFARYSVRRSPRLTFSLPFELSKPRKWLSGPNSGRMKPAIRALLRRVSLAVSLSAHIGTGDAAQTALACGFATALAKAAGAHLMRLIPNQTQTVNIAPCFAGPMAKARLRCMIKTRAGHIIAMATRIALSRIMEASAIWSTLKRLCAQPWKT